MLQIPVELYISSKCSARQLKQAQALVQATSSTGTITHPFGQCGDHRQSFLVHGNRHTDSRTLNLDQTLFRLMVAYLLLSRGHFEGITCEYVDKCSSVVIYPPVSYVSICSFTPARKYILTKCHVIHVWYDTCIMRFEHRSRRCRYITTATT